MAQKFIGLDDAAEQLGVSKERLTQLREAGKLRGYRDGASWKFRGEDVEKMASEGIPPLDSEGSDVSLAPVDEPLPLEDEPLPLEDESSAPADESAAPAEKSPAPEEEPLELADESSEEVLEESPAESAEVVAAADEGSELDLDLGSVEDAAASDVSLDDLEEPTVPVDLTEAEAAESGSDLDVADDSSDASDSILLSETEFGESGDRPPSTIIGKAELAADDEVDLVITSEDASAAEPSGSDAQLRSSASDVLSSEAAGSGVLEVEGDPSAQFEGLAELEVDLEAESSRILSPQDVAKAQQAAAPAEPSPSSELELESGESDAGLTGIGDLGGKEAESGGLTGISALELEEDEDDELVLGDGSDVTLSGESSGINLVSPSDSGLALDEVPLELSGSAAMGSSLDLGEALEDEAAGEPAAKEAGEDFLLTPIPEEAEPEAEESSSQVIALDDVGEEGEAPIFSDVGAADMLGEDLSGAGLASGAMMPAATAGETTFSTWNVLLMGSCLLLLAPCGMMVFDLLRNMWSWDQPFTLNSTLIEGLLSFFPS